jgi:hypothetical protein
VAAWEQAVQVSRSPRSPRKGSPNWRLSYRIRWRVERTFCCIRNQSEGGLRAQSGKGRNGARVVLLSNPDISSRGRAGRERGRILCPKRRNLNPARSAVVVYRATDFGEDRGSRLRRKKVTLAGRSARRRIKYGNQSTPNGMYTRTRYPSRTNFCCRSVRMP